MYGKKERVRFTDANRVAWDEVAPRHAERNQAALLEKLAQPGYNDLDDHCLARLREIGVEGKSVVQVCCNNGRDLIYVKNMGAGRCVGFDASGPFLEQARELARAAGHDDVTFMETDVYDIPAHHGDTYDLVMTTIGVVGWMPDLPAFFRVLAGLMAPGGHLFMEETHPVLMMYEPGENGAPSCLTHSYFKRDPWVETSGLDYFSGEHYAAKPTYAFPHTLAEIVMCAIDAGLTLAHFTEFGYDISGFCADLENAPATPPMGMTMVWRKAVESG